MSKKLKSIIIDNVVTLIISFIMFLGGALLISEKILPSLQVVWTFIFFIGFGIFMYNLCVLLKIGDFSKFKTQLKKRY